MIDDMNRWDEVGEYWLNEPFNDYEIIVPLNRVSGKVQFGMVEGGNLSPLDFIILRLWLRPAITLSHSFIDYVYVFKFRNFVFFVFCRWFIKLILQNHNVL